MSISGNLRTLSFTELLQWLSQGTKTGTLVVAREDVEKRVFFENGTIISTASNNPKEYLGHFLLSHGLIDEMILAKAMEMQEDSKIMLGKILVTIGRHQRGRPRPHAAPEGRGESLRALHLAGGRVPIPRQRAAELPP